MEFSSLVLMEKDSETGFLGKELGSYTVEEGREFVKRLFVYNEEVTLIFDTKEDVEEWEFSAIFDLFNIDDFVNAGYEIKEDDEEYNPTWIVNFDYVDDDKAMGDKIRELCDLIDKNMKEVFENIKGKEEEYK